MNGGAAQPPVTDCRALIDAVRRRGSVHQVKDAVPGKFTVWRHRIRQFARAGELRIRVTSRRDYAIVENVDFRSATGTTWLPATLSTQI